MTRLSLTEVGSAVLEVIAQMIAACLYLAFFLPFEALRCIICPGRRARTPASIAITGASSGIGEALALRWAAPGIHLALSGREADAKLLKQVAEECRKRGAVVMSRTFDVTDRSAVESWLHAADDAAPVDLVVANAGVSEGTTNTDGAANIAAAAQAVFSVNVDGVLHTIFGILPRMRARGRGQIAIMASIAGNAALPMAPAYAASKAAVQSYGESLRAVLHHEGINVSVIQPGFIRTPMTSIIKVRVRGMIDLSVAVAAIVDGLERDLPTITFPLGSVIATRVLGAMPWVIRDCLARSSCVPYYAYYDKSTKPAH